MGRRRDQKPEDHRFHIGYSSANLSLVQALREGALEHPRLELSWTVNVQAVKPHPADEDRHFFD
jgi:hypothetical protein